MNNNPLDSKKASNYLGNQNYFLVKFSDGRQTSYEVDFLNRLDYFKALLSRDFSELKDRTIELKNVDKKTFDLVTSLLIDKKSAQKLLSEESFQDPDLYEDLERVVMFLNSDNSVQLLKDLKQNQLNNLTLENAKKVLENYKPAQTENSPADALPHLVVLARKIVFDSKLFPSEQEASKHFADIESYQRLLRDSNQKLTKLKERYSQSRLPEIEKKYLADRIKVEEDTIATRSAQLTELKDKTDITKMSMMMRQNLSQYLNDSNPELRNMAIQATEELRIYKEQVLYALRRSGANMDRHDLLEYIIGPKGFLFDRYKLQIDPLPINSQYPFSRNGGGGFGYALDNDGPFSLESEIRNDLDVKRERYVQDRLITHYSETRPISKEAISVRDKILPVLADWDNCSDDDVKMVKEELIRLNGWDKFGIIYSDLRVSPTNEKDAQGNIKAITGHIEKFGRKQQYSATLTDCLLKLTLTRSDPRQPDRFTNEEILRNNFGPNRVIMRG